MGFLDRIKEMLNVKTAQSSERQLDLIEEKMSNPSDDLRFYENRSGRMAVHYKSTHLCLCDKGQIHEVRKYFDEAYDGDNLMQVQSDLKERYNKKIYTDRTYSKPRKVTKRGRRKKSYRENRLQFETKPSGRVQVRVFDKGKVNTICQCYDYQTERVQREYDILKNTHSLDEIKVIMKGQYNLRKNGSRKSTGVTVKDHRIHIDSNGMVYKDGKLQKIDPNIYDKVNDFL